MYHLSAENIPQAFAEAIFQMPLFTLKGHSRNGEVYATSTPATLTIYNPVERVLFDPVRDANPFFHMAETLWMFAGRRDATALTKYVRRYIEYAEPNGLIHGAYGWRWCKAFGIDQIFKAFMLLQHNPDNRQVVIQMWDAQMDLDVQKNDRPCNTHIYVRVVGGQLDFLVCNRSNDLIWGMLGANAVHFTMLQQLLAELLGLRVGVYRVITNNLHVYPHLVKNFDLLWGRPRAQFDFYRTGAASTYPRSLLSGLEYKKFTAWCDYVLENPYRQDIPGGFFSDVAAPMLRAHEAYRKEDKESCAAALTRIEAQDWKLACTEWIFRKWSGMEEEYRDSILLTS